SAAPERRRLRSCVFLRRCPIASHRPWRALPAPIRYPPPVGRRTGRRCHVNEEAFLSALHESPNDEGTWLALADWLDEDGETHRAELVRLVRRLRTLPVMVRTRRRAALEDRMIALLEQGTRPVVPEITNSLGVRLALMPSGTFRMGSPRTEAGRYPAEVTHEV